MGNCYMANKDSKSSKDMRKLKTIAFNVEDRTEYILYQHASKYRNFSRYVKSLIQRDMENGQKIDDRVYDEVFDIREDKKK